MQQLSIEFPWHVGKKGQSNTTHAQMNSNSRILPQPHIKWNEWVHR